MSVPLKPYLQPNSSIAINPFAELSPRVSWFTATQYASIYKFPQPPATPKTIGVISFGGGLFGSVDASGVLTGGDVQAYWAGLGIPCHKMPKVVVVLVDGATNSPNASDGATIENTIDVEMIGACCPTSNLTIILYIAPNSLAEFISVFRYATTVPVVVDGIEHIPNVISISWGAPEVYFSNFILNSVNTLFASAVAAGINITAASGDNGSSDGVAGGPHVDFPASSPNVVACGGTRLTCPNLVYDGATTETAWSSGGGAVSAYFARPSYQSAIAASGRAVPDIAMCADPATGVAFRVGGTLYVIGGTSIVSPAMAAYLLCVGVSDLANMHLYPSATIAGRFHDIVTGSNGDFSAGIGYDKVTGLGSIVGDVLASAMVSTSFVAVSGVSLSTASVTIPVSESYQLIPTVSPADATYKNIMWSSSNAEIATVNSSGFVTAIASGSAVITATTIDGGFTASVAVSAVIIPVDVTSVSLSPPVASIYTSRTVALTAAILPVGATNKTLAWTSSAPDVATVNSSGVVTGVANGSATISATSTDGSGRIGTALITVSTLVSGLYVSPTTASIGVGENMLVECTVLPSDLGVKWSTSRISVCRVSSNGTVTGVNPGSAIITAETVDGEFTATVSITVVRHVSSVAIFPAVAFIERGTSKYFTVTVLPINSTIRTATWTSSDPSVATVSEGIVNGVGIGAATITVSADGISKTARIIVV